MVSSAHQVFSRRMASRGWDVVGEAGWDVGGGERFDRGVAARMMVRSILVRRPYAPRFSVRSVGDVGVLGVGGGSSWS